MTIAQVYIYLAGSVPKELSRNEAMGKLQTWQDQRERWVANMMQEAFGGL